MNKILNLFNKNYVIDLFNEKILPLYPEFKAIKKINIIPAKKHVWRTTYHVVIEFVTYFLANDGSSVKRSIYLTAHSNEPRKDSFTALSFLWKMNFNQSDLMVPRPLFFSDYFNGYFYQGAEGQTLYYYINKKDIKNLENIVAKSAAWFAKLHNVPITGTENFNPENSRIETVIPGIPQVLQKINQACKRYFEPCKKIYEIIDRKEKEYFSYTNKRYLIHGDAHPKNVVKIDDDKIAVIDFTDMCLADFARDLGSFLQQLDFMTSKKINDPAYMEKIKKLFLECYQLNSKIKINDYTKQRIDNYYNWTAMRTATYFMLKYKPEPVRAHGLIVKICQNLKIKTNV